METLKQISLLVLIITFLRQIDSLNWLRGIAEINIITEIIEHFIYFIYITVILKLQLIT